jgi:hypothetical protein
MPRSFPIVQFPNRPLIAALLTAAIAHGTDGRTAATASSLSRLALIVWAAEEIVDGADWFRRMLGVSGAALAVARGRGRRLRTQTDLGRQLRGRPRRMNVP